MSIKDFFALMAECASKQEPFPYRTDCVVFDCLGLDDDLSKDVETAIDRVEDGTKPIATLIVRPMERITALRDFAQYLSGVRVHIFTKPEEPASGTAFDIFQAMADVAGVVTLDDGSTLYRKFKNEETERYDTSLSTN